MRFVFLSTQDNYITGLRAAAAAIKREHGVELTVGVYLAADLADPARRERIATEIAAADFVVGAMLFGEAYIRPLEVMLRRATCPVAILMSNPSLTKLTRIGKFNLGGKSEGDESQGGLMQSLKPKHGHGELSRQLALVKNLTKILKFLPGRFRDLHSFIVLHLFWVHNSPENLQRMLCMLAER